MRLKEDLTGKRFHRLYVKERLRDGKNYTSIYLCMCDCGNSTEVVGSRLKSGKTRSCGCLHSEFVSYGKITHGMTNNAEYHSFSGARGRCTNPKNHKFFDYGERGIEFRFTSFEQFFAEVGPKPSSKHSLDRKNNDGHYEPGNVKWSTPEEQMANRRTFSKDRVNHDVLVAYAKVAEYRGV